MIPGSFIIDGVSSEELKSFIQARPVLETPRRKVSFVDASGRSGTIPFDENAYENTIMDLNLFTMGESEEEAVFNRERIVHAFNHGSYVNFIPYFDANKIYRAMLSDSPSFTSSGVNPEAVAYTLALTVKPYKMLPSVTTELVKNSTIVNTTFYTSEPVITIYGTGDITLSINGVEFKLKGIESYIIIDTEIAHSYIITNNIIVGQNSKVLTLDYPILQPGSNVINWTGSVTKVTINPKWRSLT